LQHEFIDYLVCQAIMPYKEIANTQRAILNAVFGEMEKRAYRLKEKTIEALQSALCSIDADN